MKHTLLLACLICTALSACNGLSYPRGTGFTGIDGEPKAPAQQSDAVSRAVGPIQALAARPPQTLRVETGAPDAMAMAAIAHGGRTDAAAIPATLHGAPVMISTVEVNGTLYAVMRLPEGRGGRFAAGAGPAFAAAAPRMTGCLATGPAYRRDRPATAAGGAARLPLGPAAALRPANRLAPRGRLG